MWECPGCHESVRDEAVSCPSCGSSLPGRSATSGGVIVDTASPSSTLTVAATGDRYDAPLSSGSVFAGRFLVISRIGIGGMGEVYRAEDMRLGQTVAIKFLSRELAANERALQLFRSEVRLSREVTHQNLCRVHDIGEANGRHYLSMEFIDGEDLNCLLKRIGRLPAEKALDVARQLCAGLAAAHERGVLHRDLKPANVMLDGRGRVRITDFGLALLAGEMDPGQVSGTPHYMAPELFSSRASTVQSDIYALGLVLYEIFTGRRAFEGRTFAELRYKHERDKAPSPSSVVPDVDPRIERIIGSCLEKSPALRPGSVQEILDALNGAELPAPAADFQEPAADGQGLFGRLRQRPRGIWLAGLGLVAVAVALIAILAKWPVVQTGGGQNYIQAIAVTPFEHESSSSLQGLLEFALTRSLVTSADLPTVTGTELKLLAGKGNAKAMSALVEVRGATRMSPTGFEIDVEVRHRDEHQKGNFFARGYQDLLTVQVDRIATFIREKSDPRIWRPESPKKSFAQLCTDNPDALKHYLDGERTWSKLDHGNSYLAFRDAIEDDPDFSLARLRLADVLLFRGDSRQAAAELEVVRKGSGRLTRPDLARMSALLARMQSNSREERKHLRELVELFPFKKEYHYEFAEAYFHNAEADEAVTHYLKALELDPDYPLAHNHLGFCYSWIGDHQKAEKHFREYLRLDGTANAYDSLATGYFFAGRYDQVIRATGQGLKLDSKLDYLYGNRAKAHLALGDLQSARQDFENQARISGSEDTRAEAETAMAYIDMFGGNVRAASTRLGALCAQFRAPEYAGRLDEYPVAPFWLAGVIAARRKDAPGLASNLAVLEEKIEGHRVNGSNYFPVLKFAIHLRMLQAGLKKDIGAVSNLVEEGVRLRNKMGYWNSMFDASFFLDQYASLLLELGEKEQADRVLDAALASNPNYPPAKARRRAS